MNERLQTALRYGWTERANPDSFWMRFDKAQRAPESWRSEMFKAAHRIGNDAQKPLWLAISGGTDSEMMAHAFFDQGINFSAITLEYSGNVNRAEVDRAKRWCYSRGIPHEIVKIDAKAFLTSGVDEYISAGYSTNRVYRYVQLRLLELVEERKGFGVLGNGKINFSVLDGQSGAEAFVPLGTSYAAPYEWCERKNTAHQPYFFFSYPELLLAYFRMPFVRAAAETPTAFRNYANNVSLRRFLYQTEWPEIPARPPFLGFERLPKMRVEAEARMDAAFAGESRFIRFPIGEIVRQLS